MHDIGKITLDKNLFNTPGRLSNEALAAIKRHPEIGYRILNSVNEFKDVDRFVLEHHERWNGTGYPKGLKGNEISLGARIISVANAFDLMTSELSYKKNIDVKDAVNELKKSAGIKFDAFIVEIFIEKVLAKLNL